MGLYADESRFDRRSGLRALSFVLIALAFAYGTAWITIGRSGRFQSLKGAFFSFDLPRSFEQIDQEGSGASITSLAEAPEIERTFATALRPAEACAAMSRSFGREEVEIFRAPDPAPDADCTFSGLAGGHPMRAEVRSLAGFLARVEEEGLDLPSVPADKRTIITIRINEA